MISSNDLTSKFALDVQGVNQLRLEAKQSSPEALKAAAKQFEAVFMNMLMKSMREATPQEGLFDSEQTRMYTSMLDQQLTQRMASRGIGLAEVMVRQLSGALTSAAAAANAAPDTGAAASVSPGSSSAAPDLLLKLAPTVPLQTGPAAPLNAPGPVNQPNPGATGRSRNLPAHVDAFMQRLLPHAQAASASTGIPTHFMLGQAALETGWGKSEIRGSDGQQSHNLFGIKAGRGWQGRTTEVVTTEYVHGRAQKQVESFRAYDSYADAFRDYANMLRTQPRYQNVIAQAQDVAGFAHGLQQAGYATDPLYASKLMRVIRQFDQA
jgi:flagellar protein FlgJ